MRIVRVEEGDAAERELRSADAGSSIADLE